MKSYLSLSFRILAIAGLSFLCTSCNRSPSESGAPTDLIKVTLQTDWFAQAEHGGFYQALAKGYYREAGLDVEIIPGGPNAMTVQKVAQGVADFSLGRSDQIIVAASRGIPLVIQGAIMQQDPQAILFHKESGIRDFKDLDGKTIMAIPGSTFVRMLEVNYGIKINVIPMDFGMSRFLGDKNFIQQCFITNEPYYVQREGANIGTLLLSDSGFQPYRVWYTSRGYARGNPEVVRAFSEASIRGWNDYLTGDSSEANALIAASNPKQTPDFLAYSLKSMIDNQLVSGNPARGEALGLITRERIQEQIDQLESINILESDVSLDDILPTTNASNRQSLESHQSSSDDLILKQHFDDSIITHRISPEQMAAIGRPVRKKFFETKEEVYDMTVLYLDEFISHFMEKDESDFWIMNCGDGYQSNFDKETIQRNRPYFVLTIDEQPLVDWLADQGHPEWGPFAVNIENNEGLLDPGHKNPWGVTEIHASTRMRVIKEMGLIELSGPVARGLDLYLNSCASCHRTDQSVLGGAVSTRTLKVLAILSTSVEPYFRKLLKDPQNTNPIAEKMPSYAHWSEENVTDLIAFLNSR
jgi:NitT/TauT family transport system substrate-binding protein